VNPRDLERQGAEVPRVRITTLCADDLGQELRERRATRARAVCERAEPSIEQHAAVAVLGDRRHHARERDRGRIVEERRREPGG
jgi:hypothetical protein